MFGTRMYLFIKFVITINRLRSWKEMFSYFLLISELLVYTTQVNSAFRGCWLASAEVISQVHVGLIFCLPWQSHSLLFNDIVDRQLSWSLSCQATENEKLHALAQREHLLVLDSHTALFWALSIFVRHVPVIGSHVKCQKVNSTLDSR